MNSIPAQDARPLYRHHSGRHETSPEPGRPLPDELAGKRRPGFSARAGVSESYVRYLTRIGRRSAMSALGHCHERAAQNGLSALPPKADMCGALGMSALANSGRPQKGPFR